MIYQQLTADAIITTADFSAVDVVPGSGSLSFWHAATTIMMDADVTAMALVFSAIPTTTAATP